MICQTKNLVGSTVLVVQPEPDSVSGKVQTILEVPFEGHLTLWLPLARGEPSIAVFARGGHRRCCVV